MYVCVWCGVVWCVDLCKGNPNVAPSANTPSGKVWVGGDKGLVDYAGETCTRAYKHQYAHTYIPKESDRELQREAKPA